MQKVKVSIVGATGYTGAELVRILSRHPGVELVRLTTQSYAGQRMWEVYPHLYSFCDQTGEKLDLPATVADSDVIFIALPHGHSAPVVAEAVQSGKKVIDLGADFRLKDRRTYEAWYKTEHTAEALLQEAVYGLPELYREEIAGARLVANPGCYPTGAVLGLAPLLKNGLIDPDTIIIDAKSGVSGAGRALSLGTHFCEVNENFKAYGVASHRHTPEIEQELSRLAGRRVTVSFTPHLLPVTRGILSTIYARLTQPSVTCGELLECFRSFYAGQAFVRVLPEGFLPQIKWVAGTNTCDTGLALDKRTGRVIVVTAIDNLVKGASGQAVQNMNLMCGFPEDTALAGPALYP